MRWLILKSAPLFGPPCSLFVKTGNIRGCGTDANVFVRLFGVLGDSGDQPLTKSETHRNKFERNHTDIFTFSCVDLGVLNMLRVWHDNKGFKPGWFLDSIEVVEDDTNNRFMFPCKRWLAKSEDDRQICRELICTSDALKGAERIYSIVVKTADKADAETTVGYMIFMKTLSPPPSFLGRLSTFPLCWWRSAAVCLTDCRCAGPFSVMCLFSSRAQRRAQRRSFFLTWKELRLSAAGHALSPSRFLIWERLPKPMWG